jgi:hypothetical protein
MPPVFFTRLCQCDPAQGGTMYSRSGEPIPCYEEEIPCFAAEQGIASKALGLLREMTVRLAKMGKKDLNLAKFPCSFPCTQGIRPSRLLQPCGHVGRDVVDVLDAGGEAPQAIATITKG